MTNPIQLRPLLLTVAILIMLGAVFAFPMAAILVTLVLLVYTIAFMWVGDLG